MIYGTILPKEKPPKTVGGPPIIPYQKVFDEILWKMLPSMYVEVLLSIIGDFTNGIDHIFSKEHGIDY
jgi:hypothetical protein